MHWLPTRVRSHLTLFSHRPDTSASRLSCDGGSNDFSQKYYIVIIIIIFCCTVNTILYVEHARRNADKQTRTRRHSSRVRSTHLGCDGKFTLAITEVNQLLRLVVYDEE